MLRVPNRLFAGSGTGGTNARVQRRLGGEAAKIPRRNALSRSMRRRSDSGGLTKSGETVSVRVGKDLRLDDNRPRHPKRSGREARFDRCDIGRRLLIEIDPDQRAPAAVIQEEGGRMAAEQLDVDRRRLAVHTHREHDELSRLQRARGDRRRQTRRFQAATLRPGSSRRYQQHDDRGDGPLKPHRSEDQSLLRSHDCDAGPLRLAVEGGELRREDLLQLVGLRLQLAAQILEDRRRIADRLSVAGVRRRSAATRGGC